MASGTWARRNVGEEDVPRLGVGEAGVSWRHWHEGPIGSRTVGDASPLVRIKSARLPLAVSRRVAAASDPADGQQVQADERQHSIVRALPDAEAHVVVPAQDAPGKPRINAMKPSALIRRAKAVRPRNIGHPECGGLTSLSCYGATLRGVNIGIAGTSNQRRLSGPSAWAVRFRCTRWNSRGHPYDLQKPEPPSNRYKRRAHRDRLRRAR